jgi:hypothetical protein
MTFEQLAHDHLFNNGMFEDNVSAVIELAKKDEVLDSMSGRWTDKTDDYPPFMEKIFILSLDHVALKYIDENIPQAWFRPVFEHKQAQ